MKLLLPLKLSILVLVITLQTAQAQVAISDQVGIPVPDSAAILDLQSNSRGMLPPRLTELERNAISNPPTGLVVLNTTSNCLQIYYPLQGWTDIACDCAATPNSAFTSPGSVFEFASASFSASAAGLNYSWNFSGASPATSNVQNPSVTWTSAGTYPVSLTVTDGLGCTSTSYDTITVQPCVPPSSAFTFPGTIAINNAATFSATQGGLNYAWTFPSGSPSTSSSQNPSITWTSSGTYTVTLITSDANGCSDTTSQSVTVINCVTGGSVTFNNTSTGPYGSYQQWIVPVGVCDITIEARGARGGGTGGGGLGAQIQGDFSVSAGDTLTLLVGQMGESGSGSCGGGGGGTFVALGGQYQTANLLIAAAGGGGYGTNGTHDMNGQSGTSGVSSCNATGGTNGNGGGAYQAGNAGGGGGGGLLTDGQDSHYGLGGHAFRNGGDGGDNNTSGSLVRGGFGGGGAGHYNCEGGGGGGYSGGASGGYQGSCRRGGGGGSFNGGINQTNQSGINTGHGQVTITW